MISYGGVEIAGAVQVDLTNPYYGTEEKFIDLTLGYRGKASDWKWLAWLGDKTIDVGLNVRNVLDKYSEGVTSMVDIDGNPLRYKRVNGRQFIFSLEIEY